MNMSIQNLFSTNIRISDLDILDANSVVPANVELVIGRVPVRKSDGYSKSYIESIAKKLKQAVVKNGIIFLICYAPNECKSRPFEIASAFVDEGFNHIDNIIIEKSWLPGKRSEANLVNSHEYVLHFCNGSVWNLDRLPIKEYLKLDEDSSCAGNLWRVETGSLEESYPPDLAELLIRMTDILPGSVILDPWMGSIGALQTCLKLNHTFYGFETNQRKYKKYRKIIDSYQQDKK
jgi:hypothetical protein